jgi:hypothetical protein
MECVLNARILLLHVIAGRVASNGNFRAVNFAIGSGITSCNASLPALVIAR